MGTYLNPGYGKIYEALASQIYVDKSEIPSPGYSDKPALLLELKYNKMETT